MLLLDVTYRLVDHLEELDSGLFHWICPKCVLSAARQA